MPTNVKRAIESDLPKRLGRYDAFLQIGQGGMARVFLASHKQAGGTNELVVIKQLRREVADDAAVHDMFVDEARIAMRLDHPNVVRTRDVVADAPNYFLAMEYLDGQALLEVTRRLNGAIPIQEHLWILTQVLAGLRHAHELKDENGRPLGIVHRDVSPANVVVCYDGNVKLLDFGIAKATGAVAATQDGVVKGKLGYASPEQCLGKPADPRSDLYSVGVMLWEAVAGRRRSAGETRQAMLQARIDDTDLPLEEVRPDAPAELVAMTKRALSRDPNQRFQTAREFQTTIEHYLSRFSRRVAAPDVAMLIAPLFAEDRAAVQRAIDNHLGPNQNRGGLRIARGSSISGTVPRIPPPPPPPSSKRLPQPEPFDEDLDDADLTLTNDGAEEEPHEDTSPIPVDQALLIQSRRESKRPSNPSRGPSTMPSRPSVTPDVAIPSNPPPSVHEARTIAPPSSTSSTAQVTSLRDDALKKKPPWAIIGGAGAAVIVAVIVLATRGSGDKTDATPAATAVAPGVTETAAPANNPAAGQPAAPVQSAAAPKAGEVKVRIAAKPEGARMRIDGRLLKANPFEGNFPKDDREHTLTINADNYHEFVDVLKFNEDQDIEITLDSTKGPQRPRAARIVRIPSGSAAAAAPASPSPAPVEARPTPATRGAEPGMDMELRPSAPPKRNIDEKDPYAQ